MSIAQQFGSACELADIMPRRVADFIEIDKVLKRRFREDSMTDILIASFLQLPVGQVKIDTPRESVTGSDFDLFVASGTSFDLTHYRIQAKRLLDHKTWKNGLYRCLDHRVGKTGRLQCDILCASAAARDLIPLYAFYNHANVVAASGGVVQGISLADAFAIRHAVGRVVAGDTAYKRVGTLMPLFFPLSTILCAPTPGGRIASPAESSDAARTAIRQAHARWQGAGHGSADEVSDAIVPRETAAVADGRVTGTEVEQTPQALAEPTPLTERDDVLAAVRSGADGPRVRVRAIQRPRLILIGDQSDSRTASSAASDRNGPR